MMRLKKILTNAVVLLKVDNVLSNHDRVLDVRLHPLKALDALVAGVPASISISLHWQATQDVQKYLVKVVAVVDYFDQKVSLTP